jgi:hypothetical protein
MPSAASSAQSSEIAGQNTGNSLRSAASSVSGENQVELKYRSVENLAADKFARGLGLFSFALGLAEILMPAQVGTAMGVSRKHRDLLPALGARELLHGVAIFSSPKPSAAVWSRVGGDLLDLAYLSSAFTSKDSNKRRLVGATVMILGATAMDLLCATKLSNQNWSANDTNPMAPTTVGQPSARTRPSSGEFH